MYLPYTLSFFKLVLPETQNCLDKPVCFTHANVLLSYINETVYLLRNLPFFVSIHVNHFMARDDSPCASVISKCMLWVRGLVSLWVLRHFFSLISSLLYGEGDGTPLQYSCLENPMDRGAWWAAVHGVTKSRTRLSDFTFTFHFHALEKDMATHSSVLAWRIPGTGEPDGLLSMGSHSQTRLKRLKQQQQQ